MHKIKNDNPRIFLKSIFTLNFILENQLFPVNLFFKLVIYYQINNLKDFLCMKLTI